MEDIIKAIKELMQQKANNNKYTDYLLLMSRLLPLYNEDICMNEELAKSIIDTEIKNMYAD